MLVYVVVVRVVALVGPFSQCLLSLLLLVLLLTLLFLHVGDHQDCIYKLGVFAFVFLRARVCAAAAAAAPVVLYSRRSFPHRGRCLPSLLLRLLTSYAFGGVVVTLPARSRP